MNVHLNGRIVPENEARISPDDRGFLMGDGVFETLRTYGGHLHAWDEHVERLRRSCATARLPFPDDLREKVVALLRANGLADAAVRITLTRGPGGRGASPQGAGPPTVLITAKPIQVPASVYETGVRLLTCARRRIGAEALDPGMKTTNYLVNVLARIEAEENGADDALFVDADGFVVEATQANLFAIEGDALLTPPLSSGCLPGVTRATLLRIAKRSGFTPRETPLRADALAAMDEVFLASSVTELAPVVSVDGARVGEGRPGERTRALHRAYRAHASGPSPG